MKLQLVTLSGVKLDRDVYEVQLPTTEGPIGVFPKHEPLVTMAVDGVITVRFDKHDSDGMREYFAISGGVIEIDQDTVKVLVDEADSGDDIIEAESQAALERALEMQKSASNPVELEEAHRLVNRHQVRLKVSDLRRRNRRV